MCRSLDKGGRRCGCSRGDRRRAYQRLRYARIKASADTAPSSAPTSAAGTASSTRSAEHIAAEPVVVAHAWAALRDQPDDPELRAAYTAAVINHGAALRDRATERIAAEFTRLGIDDTAVTAEAATIKQRILQSDADLAADQLRITNATQAGTIADPAAELKAAEERHLIRCNNLRIAAYNRTQDLNTQRTQVIRDSYYHELATERTFGNAEFTPSNNAKMTKKDRAIFAATTALYPDEMVQRSAELGEMLAKRSTARAHYTSSGLQRKRRTRHQVFALDHALRTGKLTHLNSYYVDSPDEMATGTGSVTDKFAHHAATLVRTPDNERRISEMMAEYNARATKPVTMHFATATATDGTTHEVIYLRSSRTRITNEVAGTSAEITYNDPSSMTHELAHRMEDRNPEISIATKTFLHRRTAGLPRKPYLHRTTEMVVEDGFANCYMGKDYANQPSHTEIFSTGMEAITAGAFGGLRGDTPVDLLNRPHRPAPPRADPEHLALILGILATANKHPHT